MGDSYDVHQERAEEALYKATREGRDTDTGLTWFERRAVQKYRELDEKAQHGFFHGMWEAGVKDLYRPILSLLTLRHRQRLGRRGLAGPNDRERPTGGQAWLNVGASAGLGMTARWALRAFTGLASDAITAFVGAGVALSLAALTDQLARRTNGVEGAGQRYAETTKHRIGRIGGIMLRGAGMALLASHTFGPGTEAGHFIGEKLHDLGGLVAEGASKIGDHLPDLGGKLGAVDVIPWLDGDGFDFSSLHNGGSGLPDAGVPDGGTVSSVDTPPSTAGGGTTVDGQTPPPGLPEQPATADDWTTNEIGRFGGTNAVTDYLRGTGYNAVAEELMKHYQATTGLTLNWAEVSKLPGFEQEYHSFMDQVLKDNGLSWEDAKHMSNSATLEIKPGTLEAFAGRLSEMSGGQYGIHDFVPDKATVPDAPSVDHPGGGPLETTSGAAPEVSPTGEVAAAQVVIDDFTSYMANNPLGADPSSSEYLQQYLQDLPTRNPEAYAILQYGLSDDARRILEGQFEYAVMTGQGLETAVGDINGFATVLSNFDGYLTAHPVDVSTTPGLYLSDYLDQLEGSADSTWQAYDGMHTAAQYALLQRLLEGIVESQKELASVNA